MNRYVLTCDNGKLYIVYAADKASAAIRFHGKFSHVILGIEHELLKDAKTTMSGRDAGVEGGGSNK